MALQKSRHLPRGPCSRVANSFDLLRDPNQRRSRLVKYVPDATRSIFGILDVMRKRKAEAEEEAEEGGEIQVHSRRKNPRTVAAARISEQENTRTIKQLDEEVITEDVIQSCLLEAIEAQQGSLADGVENSGGDKKTNGLKVWTTQARIFIIVC
jgi:hypothetical protein